MLKHQKKNLDLDYDKGGSGWNRQRARSFVKRLRDIMRIVEAIAKGKKIKAVDQLSQYLINLFKLKLDDKSKKRFNSFLKLRITNKIDREGLRKGMDTSKILGGVGFYKNTAEKNIR